MPDSSVIHQWVAELLIITRTQEEAIAEEGIVAFLELSDQRQICIDDIIQAAKDPAIKFQLLENQELSTKMATIMAIDRKNMKHIQKLMEHTQKQLRQISTGRSAFYAYVGKDSLIDEETHFIDRQQT